MRDQELAGEKVPGSEQRGWWQREERHVERWENMYERGQHGRKMQYNVGHNVVFREIYIHININDFRMLS